MKQPINVFWNLYNLLKDLVVSVKIGSSKADPYGSVLEQLSSTQFKVTDNEGNEGVCELVDKTICGTLHKQLFHTFKFIWKKKMGMEVVEKFKNLPIQVRWSTPSSKSSRQYY